MNFPTFKRWLYSGGKPNMLARLLNRAWANLHTLGIAPNYLVTLEVIGRESKRTISFPLVMVVVDGQRYLVSMLGVQAAWVKNIHAADGIARLRHGKIEAVRLQEIPAAQRGPILKAYLQIAPGARPHIPIDKDAPLADFAAIVTQFPVFRVDTIPS